MKFGPIRITQAEGSVLAHSVGDGALRLRKGHRLTRDDVTAMQAAGLETAIVAVFEPGDIGEDEAATKIAATLEAGGIECRRATTGRVNLHATRAGIFRVEKLRVDAINAVDPDVTLATLADYASVQAGQMVATVKIIPFAVPGAVIERVVGFAAGSEVCSVHGFTPKRVALIQTELPSVKASVLDKTVEVTRARLARSESILMLERRVAHRAGALAEAIDDIVGQVDMVMIFGASAVSDAHDVIPSAIRTARGVVKRVGMPVDPGNLLVLGELDGKPVIGAPGCARSPKENGFDWVLDRLIAGLPIGDTEIAGMGVGGLLTEIGTRPAPRERASCPPKGKSVEVHAVVLAAGRSSRMGGPNKLLARFDGVPLIRRTVERVVDSRVAGTFVVTGHQADDIAAAIGDTPAPLIHNPSYADGLAGSLKAGVAALPASSAGAIVVLGDMPQVTTEDVDRLITAFVSSGGTSIVRATHGGKRGNPVILPRASFAMLADLEGDTGARALVESCVFETIDVELGTAASLDVDTPEAMRIAGGVLTA